MDTAHWPQEIAMKANTTTTTTTNSCSKQPSSSSLERRTRPQKESAINCPRCNSTNTKFCYYNNYSLSQPRYFCKTCRRYWTEGGSLRNVPVGGGSRKNKRSSSSSISSHSSISKKLPDLVVPPAVPTLVSQNPRLMHHHHENGHDLNLGCYPSTNDFKTISDLIQVPNFDANKNTNNSVSNTTTATTTTTTSSSAQLSALELLTGISTRGMMNSFMPIPIPDPNSVYSSSGQLMIPMPDFKIPSLNFSLDGNGINGGNSNTYGSSIVHEDGSSGRLLFPFEDLKTSVTTTATTTHNVDQQNTDHNADTNGFWSGMLGGSW